MNDKAAQHSRLHLFIPALAVLISVFPYLIEGLPRGHDFLFEYIRIIEYQNAITDGQFPPYWGPDHYGGHGSPIFLFYPPLFTSVNTILSYVVPTVTGIAISLSAFTIISAIGIYLVIIELSRNYEYIAANSARIAVYVLVLSPYLLGNSLLRNANAEFAALCLAPFVFLGIFRFRNSFYSGFIIFTISMTLVILTHNITALSIAVISIIFCISLYPPTQNKIIWIKISTSYIYSLLISSFFWLPALAYKNHVRTESLISGKFDFHRNFPTMIELFFSGGFYSVGPALAILISLSILIAATRAKHLSRLYLTIASIIAFLLYLTSQSSTVLWELIPLIKFYQFPWRLAGPLVLLTSIFIAISYSIATTNRDRRYRRTSEIFVLTLCLLSAAPSLMKHHRISSSEIPRLLDHKRNLGLAYSATVANEYIPKTLKAPNYITPSIHVATYPTIDMDIKNAQPRLINFNTNDQEACVITIGRWDFPGWSVTIDGINTQHKMSTTGLIEFNLSPGTHTVQIASTPPILRTIFTYVSLISLIIFLLHALYLRKQIEPTSNHL